MLNLLNLLPKQKVPAKFRFELAGFFAGGFSKVRNIQKKIERETYSEGGLNTKPVILATQQKSTSQLVLEKGYVLIHPMLIPFNLEHQLESHVFSYGTLLVLNEKNLPMRMFILDKGIVSEWSMSDLDATSPGIMVDSITIVHSGLIEVPVPNLF